MHMDMRGEALVLAIEPCPVLPPVSLDVPEGHVYRLVTATFSHSSGDVYDLTLVSEGSEVSNPTSEIISGTGMHPVWSLDQGDWVSLQDLEPGERVQTLDGASVVQAVVKRDEAVPVFNFEVEGDHVYRVGASGVLVHNASTVANQAQFAMQDQSTQDLITAAWNSRNGTSPIFIDPTGRPAAANNFASILVMSGTTDAIDVDDAAASQIGHAEAVLIAQSAPPDSGVCVLSIFTERNPCGSCNNAINEQGTRQGFPIDVYSFGIAWVPALFMDGRRAVARVWIDLEFYTPPNPN